MSARRLVVDTSVAAYMLHQRAPRGQEDKQRLAQRLVELPFSEWTLCLPAPALGEVLTGVATGKRDGAMEHLERMFEFLAYDRDAARRAADIVQPALAARHRATKQQVKIDVEIIACALRWSADALCTYDADHARIITNAGIMTQCGPPSRFLDLQEPLPLATPD